MHSTTSFHSSNVPDRPIPKNLPDVTETQDLPAEAEIGTSIPGKVEFCWTVELRPQAVAAVFVNALCLTLLSSLLVL